MRCRISFVTSDTDPLVFLKKLSLSELAQVFDALSYYSDHQEEIHQHKDRNRIPDDLIDPLVKGS